MKKSHQAALHQHRPGFSVALSDGASGRKQPAPRGSALDLLNKQMLYVLPELTDFSHVSNYWGSHRTKLDEVC